MTSRTVCFLYLRFILVCDRVVVLKLLILKRKKYERCPNLSFYELVHCSTLFETIFANIFYSAL